MLSSASWIKIPSSITARCDLLKLSILDNLYLNGQFWQFSSAVKLKFTNSSSGGLILRGRVSISMLCGSICTQSFMSIAFCTHEGFSFIDDKISASSARVIATQIIRSSSSQLSFTSSSSISPFLHPEHSTPSLIKVRHSSESSSCLYFRQHFGVQYAYPAWQIYPLSGFGFLYSIGKPLSVKDARITTGNSSPFEA